MTATQATNALAALTQSMAGAFDLDRSNVLALASSIGTQADLSPSLAVLTKPDPESKAAPGHEAVGVSPEPELIDSSIHETEPGSEELFADEPVGSDTADADDVVGELGNESVSRLLDDGFLDDIRSARSIRLQFDDEIYLSDDAVKDHMRKVGRAYLLKAEDEVRLATMIEVGLLARHRLEDPNFWPISRGDQRRLDLLAGSGRLAFDAMAHANLRLVVSIARKYTELGLEFLDLVQEGSIGLLHAIEMFDNTKGFKFSTYSSWWIRQSIARAVHDKGSLIRLPVHVHESLAKLRRVQREVESRGEVATAATLARLSGMSLKRVKDLVDVQDNSPISYDIQLSSDDGASLLDLLSAERGTDPVYSWDVGYRSLTTDVLGGALAQLGPKERAVMVLRFGLNGEDPMTLDSIGATYGVTRERIRQIEKKSLQRLRVLLEDDQLIPALLSIEVGLPNLQLDLSSPNEDFVPVQG